MRDADVRQILRDRLHATYAADDDARLVEELGLCKGTIRADIAVVNGILKGYEIKSDKDTLARLKMQASVYNQVFDTVTLVLAERHLKKAKRLVPQWWGLEVASFDAESCKVKLNPVREEQLNTDIDALALAQLLWRDEVLSILKKNEDVLRFHKKPRTFLWKFIAEAMPLDDLKATVRLVLKNRKGWRVDERRTLNGVTCPLSSKWSDSQVLSVRQRTRKYTCRPN
jgi:hypothetical protein